MKKLVLLLTIITLSYSCSSDSNSNSNNPSNGNVNYYFKIKINGVEHKVQGVTIGNEEFYAANNSCSAMVTGTTSLMFSIDDITRSNYVSGQNLKIQISIPNCHLGLNQADVSIQSPLFEQPPYLNSAFFVENSGLYCNTNYANICQGPLISEFFNKITINITDMGTPQVSQGYGNTFKGSYNGPIYFGTSTTNPAGANVYNMNIPKQFSMEFEAYRVN